MGGAESADFSALSAQTMPKCDNLSPPARGLRVL